MRNGTKSAPESGPKVQGDRKAPAGSADPKSPCIGHELKTVCVALGERSYPIHIGEGLLSETGRYFREHCPGAAAAAVVTDDHVAPLYLQGVLRSLEAAGVRAVCVTLPHGERTKCLSRLSELYAFFAQSHITRTDAVIALGGGVIGDLAGLAAATWLRGVRFAQLPTTLLSQVDSSVGGKVAVDLPEGKNLVGAFWQPSFVLIDPGTLTTLTDHFWLDGLGEVVKYGAIGDETLFRLLEEAAPGGRDAVMERIPVILERCVRAKADLVAQDERDTGLRATLNFGHTVGHAIETLQHYEGLSHGQAVAAGMAVITRLSEGRGMTEPGTAERLIALERALGLPHVLPDLPEDTLIAAMAMDKKNTAGALTVILLDRIGSCRAVKTNDDFFRGMQKND